MIAVAKEGRDWVIGSYKGRSKRGEAYVNQLHERFRKIQEDYESKGKVVPLWFKQMQHIKLEDHLSPLFGIKGSVLQEHFKMVEKLREHKFSGYGIESTEEAKAGGTGGGGGGRQKGMMTGLT